MKIRRGFVSNSSSTSFSVVMKRDVFNQAIKKLHPYIRHFVDSVRFKVDKFAGEEVMVMSETFYSEDFCVYGYKGDEGIDCEGKVVKLKRNEYGEIENIDDCQLETDCGAIEIFVEEAKKIDPDGVVSLYASC